MQFENMMENCYLVLSYTVVSKQVSFSGVLIRTHKLLLSMSFVHISISQQTLQITNHSDIFSCCQAINHICLMSGKCGGMSKEISLMNLQTFWNVTLGKNLHIKLYNSHQQIWHTLLCFCTTICTLCIRIGQFDFCEKSSIWLP